MVHDIDAEMGRGPVWVCFGKAVERQQPDWPAWPRDADELQAWLDAKGLRLAFAKGWPGEPERHAEAAKRGWQKRQRSTTTRQSPPAPDSHQQPEPQQPEHDTSVGVPLLREARTGITLTFPGGTPTAAVRLLYGFSFNPVSRRERQWYVRRSHISPEMLSALKQWASGDPSAVISHVAREDEIREAQRQAEARAAQQRAHERQVQRAQERAQRAQRRAEHEARVAAMSPEERERYEAGKARRRERDRRRRQRDRFVRRWVAHSLYWAPHQDSRRYEYDTDRYIDDLAEHCGREADYVVDRVEAGSLDSDIAIDILDELQSALSSMDPYVDTRIGQAMRPARERLTGKKGSRYEAVGRELGMPADSRTVARVVAEEISMEEAREIADRIRYRHESTDYEDLLRQGYSKEDARAAMQYRPRKKPNAHKAIEGDIRRRAEVVPSRHDETLPQADRGVKSRFVAIFKTTHPEKRPRRGTTRRTPADKPSRCGPRGASST